MLRSDIRLRRVIVLEANIILLFAQRTISRRAPRGISLRRSRNITSRTAENITFAQQKYHCSRSEQSHIRHICTECPVAGTNRSVTSAVRSFIYPVVVPSLHP